MTNPLLEVCFDIPFDRITADDVEPAIDHHLAEAQRRVDEITDSDEPRTYANTLGALDGATEALEWASGIVSHLESVATYPAFREAYDRIQPKLSRFWTSLTLHPGVWKALQELAATEEAQALDPTRRRYLEVTLDELRRQGAELDDTGKQRIEEINVRLAELTTRFSQNLLDATNAFELIIDDKERLAGLPDTAIAAARQSAAAKGVDGWRFTLQAPSVIPVLTYLDDRQTRETVWRAYNTRATAAPYDNQPLLQEILALRHEKARILGYDDFADLVLENRMAQTGAAARAFVDDLHKRTLDAFARENAQLIAFRERDDGEPTLQPWDLAYYAERQRKAEYDFDEEALRPYFPVDQVLSGLFQTIERLYGVTIADTTDLPTWDPSVRTYRLQDGDGSHLGSFYVDLYPRENKRDGAWMNSLVVAVPPAPHLGLFCANANPPVDDRPALLTHREVETLFHEFGHLMHQLLSRVPVRGLAGTNVAWDFVELPSQIMENWCWEREALDLFARHWESGELIPDGLYDSMVRARTYRAANQQMRQLGFAAVDLGLHCEYVKAGGSDPMTFAREILQSHSATPLPDDYGFLAGFGHLFSSPVAYAAGYYSYKWSEVLDADAFTRFREAGIFDRTVGREFRDNILAQGDSRPPMELFESFMGRPPSQDALLERLGLQGAS